MTDERIAELERRLAATEIVVDLMLSEILRSSENPVAVAARFAEQIEHSVVGSQMIERGSNLARDARGLTARIFAALPSPKVS